MILRGLRWRQEVLYLSVAAMEACWLYPWFLLGHRMLGDSTHPPSILFLFVPLLVALYLTRTLLKLQLEMRWNRVIIALSAVVACLVAPKYYLYGQYSLLDPTWLWNMARALADLANAIPVEILVIVLVLYLWWRGISLGQQSLTFAKVGFYFRLGIVTFIWYLFLTFFGPDQEVTVFIFIYFFFGLIAVALARIEEVSQLRGGVRSPFNAYWLGVLVLATLVVLLIGFLAFSIFSLQNAYHVLGWLHPLEPVLEAAFYFVFAILGYLLQPLVEALILILSERFAELGLSELLILQETPQELQAAQASSPPGYLGILRGCITVFILLAALIAVARSLQRWWARQEERGDELRESLWSSGSIAQGVLGSVRDGWDRLGELAGMVRRFGLGRDLYSVISIKKIYASLVRLAEIRGYPRPVAQTPYEYLDTLYRALLGSEAEVAAITEAYVGVHYGELPHSADDLRHIRECWARVRWRDEQRQRFGPGKGAGEISPR
jgi:hypothetical protein